MATDTHTSTRDGAATKAEERWEELEGKRELQRRRERADGNAVFCDVVIVALTAAITYYFLGALGGVMAFFFGASMIAQNRYMVALVYCMDDLSAQLEKSRDEILAEQRAAREEIKSLKRAMREGVRDARP
jgi:hypothetical protein